MNLRTRPGITLAQSDGLVIDTERLILRQWSGADVAPNTAMLSDPVAGRFITADGKPVTDEFVGWRNAAIMAGHWALHGVGMFVVEETTSGKFVGRVGPWFPPAWPGGFEVGWGIAAEFRGKGYAVEAARALPFPFTLTARAENLLWGRNDLDDTIKRLQAYEAVGADVLYSPGVHDIGTIRTVVSSVTKPFNLVMGFADPMLTVDQLSAAGVKRISVGGAMARHALSAFLRSAHEMKDQGAFTFVRDMAPVKEVRAAFK